MKCLEKDKSDRPQSSTELLSAFDPTPLSPVWGPGSGGRSRDPLFEATKLTTARPAAATTTAGSTRVLILRPHGHRHTRDRHLETGETARESRTDLIGSHPLAEATPDRGKVTENRRIVGASRQPVTYGRERLIGGKAPLR